MKGVVLISDGIDSPVAAYMMKNRGMKLIFLHMINEKNRKSVENVKQLIKKISPDSKFLTKKHYDTQEKIKKNCNTRYQCVLCKRAMLRAAEIVALKEKAKFIVVGDNLGQVASQTLDNLFVLDNATMLPVLRPLLGFDKNEIVAIARRIGTYEISTRNTSACMFLPKKPVTKARLQRVIQEEKKVE